MYTSAVARYSGSFSNEKYTAAAGNHTAQNRMIHFLRRSTATYIGSVGPLCRACSISPVPTFP